MSTQSLHPLPGPPTGQASQEFLQLPEMLGESASISRLRTHVRRLGPHFRTALLRGEPGTGKELVARTLHSLSSHASGPFVVFRAAEDDESVGSLMKRAHRGTLYLDRIEKATPETQLELLDALKSREHPRQLRIVVHGLEARVVASTTEDLRILTAAGRFRLELYTRLAAVELELPPLRERPEDIALLVEYFLTQHVQRHGGHHTVSAKAIKRMQEYHWPGNVSELEKWIRRAAVEGGREQIEAEHLVLAEAMPELESASLMTGSTRLQEVVEQHVFQVLKRCAGNKVKAAELLGISRSTLYRMLDSGL